MRDSLALMIGIAIPSFGGWLLLRTIEHRHLLFHPMERVLWSMIIGPTLSMFVAFVLWWIGIIRFDLGGFLLAQGIVYCVLLIITIWTRPFVTVSVASLHGSPTRKLHKYMSIALGILILWTAGKIMAGTADLMLTPSYWDDTFNNWNMRAKVIYVTQDLPMQIPLASNEMENLGGISSYPPTVSLIKAWLSTVRMKWSEPLVNGIHGVWFLLLLVLFLTTLRRYMSLQESLCGVYLLVSLPLVLIQGSNPYADIFIALHLFAAVACLLHASAAHDVRDFGRWMLLAALMTGLLTLTKNEGSVIFLPLLIISAVGILYAKNRKGVLDTHGCFFLFGLMMSITWSIILPWMSYKWLHGLTFGNAKSIADLSFAYHADALRAIVFQLTHEANMLLLPLLFIVSLLYGRKRVCQEPFALLAFIIITALAGQICIFVFTPLATEAVRQTGFSRGIVQIAPLALLFVMLLWSDLLKGEGKG